MGLRGPSWELRFRRSLSEDRGCRPDQAQEAFGVSQVLQVRATGGLPAGILQMSLLGGSGGRGDKVKGLVDTLRDSWNVAERQCQLCVHFLSKALKIKLPCLNIYF